MTTTAHPAAAGRARTDRTLILPFALAGVCWTVGQAVLPDMGTAWPERYDAVAAERGAEATSTLLLFLAGAALVVAALRLGRVAPAGRLVSLGTVLLGLGGVWLCAGRAAFNLKVLAATAPGVPREHGLTVLDSTSGAFAVFPLTLLALLLGPVLLGLSVRRSTWVPLALWVVGIGVFLGSEFSVKPLEVVGVALASAGLVLVAAAVSRSGAGADGG